VILSAGRPIAPQDLRFEDLGDIGTVPLSVQDSAESRREKGTVPEMRDTRLQDNLQTVESRLILDALQRGGGSRKRAAELLGISPRTLRYKLARLRHSGVPVPGRASEAVAHAIAG